MSPEPCYTIGQLARQAGLRPSTLRYYERRGLVRPATRSAGNYRLYGPGALDRLRFLRAARAAGFTLADIALLLRFGDGDAAPCKQVQGLIAARLERVAEQLAHLRQVERLLRRWLAVCRQSERSGRCGVLARLSLPEKKRCKKGANPP